MAAQPPDFSIVLPAYNEAPNVAPMLAALREMMTPLGRYEILYVDDGSSDTTPIELARIAGEKPWLTVLRHEASCGQSCAVRSGARVARGAIIVTLDGDGQNDPAYIPALVQKLREGGEGTQTPPGATSGH